MAAEDVEIVVSDYGSGVGEARRIASAADAFGARVVATPERGVWNRARALNVGIQAATAPWVLCTDVDLIFAPNLVSTALEEAERPGRRAMVLCHCWDLPSTLPERDWALSDFTALRERAALRKTRGTGACQVARRDFFFRVRGYDERYRYWGAEDVDMSSRAEAFGLELVWISDRTCVLHQWHPTRKGDRRLRYHWNRLRYRLTRRVVIKNRRGWGRDR